MMTAKANPPNTRLRELHRHLLPALLACSVVGLPQTADARTPSIPWELIDTARHDTDRFTQGLDLRDGVWLESSGGFGNSFAVLEVEGNILARFDLPSRHFAEGATFTDDHIWLITWHSGIARVFDQALNELRSVIYDGQGWGLTWDGHALIMSDGSSELVYRDPESFEARKRIVVRDGPLPVALLNELEYAHGLVWANVFRSNRIAAINPDLGTVCGWLDLGKLARSFARPGDWDATNNVLNGIAVDDETGHLWVTGKRWPRRFELRVDRSPELRRCARDKKRE